MSVSSGSTDVTGMAMPVPGQIVQAPELIAPEDCSDAITVYERRREWVAGTDAPCVLGLTSDWATRDPFLMRLMDPIATTLVEANRAQWGFGDLEISHMQLLSYSLGNGHAPHADGNLDHRRQWLGIVAMLSDSGDYTGGELVIARDRRRIRQQAGSVLFIPGNWCHWVEPLTSGRRYVLTAFACTGPLR